MNWTIPIGFALFLIGAALFLAQLWLCYWTPGTFLRLMATVGILMAVVVARHFVLREMRDAASLRNRHDLD